MKKSLSESMKRIIIIGLKDQFATAAFPENVGISKINCIEPLAVAVLDWLCTIDCNENLEESSIIVVLTDLFAGFHLPVRQEDLIEPSKVVKGVFSLIHHSSTCIKGTHLAEVLLGNPLLRLLDIQNRLTYQCQKAEKIGLV